MKFLFMLFIALLSTGVFAVEVSNDVKICYTHGQCQDSMPEWGVKCFIVKTGSNADGSTSCALRCPSMRMGSYCDFIPGHAFGVCKKESYPVPVFDPNDCSTAVDPSDF